MSRLQACLAANCAAYLVLSAYRDPPVAGAPGGDEANEFIARYDRDSLVVILIPFVGS